ncbi:interleukin-36 alpha-like [Gracilinanus agilis]|uniref:interleukin-36 alpha-like n=1 Tax=Gracilinanus agilis TaxID=191870 RepID=UPI001CFE1973|nr:interleukin-36 alpha-like [Gracilinanus agilis]
MNQEVAFKSFSGETPRRIVVRDTDQQVWVLQGKSLIAIPQYENVTPAKVLTISCRDEDYLDKNKGNAIYLGLNHFDGLSLSCVESGGHATLKLEEKKITDLYNSKKAEKPFVFYLKETGNTATFESAACPGWFICTSKMGEPVSMTQDSGKEKHTNFYLED